MWKEIKRIYFTHNNSYKRHFNIVINKNYLIYILPGSTQNSKSRKIQKTQTVYIHIHTGNHSKPNISIHEKIWSWKTIQAAIAVLTRYPTSVIRNIFPLHSYNISSTHYTYTHIWRCAMTICKWKTAWGYLDQDLGVWNNHTFSNQHEQKPTCWNVRVYAGFCCAFWNVALTCAWKFHDLFFSLR